MTRASLAVVVIAEELAAVVVFLLERVERAGREDGGGLGRAARDAECCSLLGLERRRGRSAGCGRSPGSR